MSSFSIKLDWNDLFDVSVSGSGFCPRHLERRFDLDSVHISKKLLKERHTSGAEKRDVCESLI